MQNSDFITNVRAESGEEAPKIELTGADGTVFAEETDEVLAKKVSTRQYDSFFVKRNMYGFHNPYGISKSKDLKFTKVSEDVYKHYVHFLKTKDLKFLSNAERIR